MLTRIRPARPNWRRTSRPRRGGCPGTGSGMLVSRRAAGEISHHAFTDLPGLLLPGDLLVVNTSATLSAAAVRQRPAGWPCHCTSPRRCRTGTGWSSCASAGAAPPCRTTAAARPGAGPARRRGADPGRARHRAAVAGPAVHRGLPYLLTHGSPIRYSYVSMTGRWRRTRPCSAPRPGSAEMPSASRPFTPEIVTRLVARGITFAPLTLHTGRVLAGRRTRIPTPSRTTCRPPRPGW